MNIEKVSIPQKDTVEADQGRLLISIDNFMACSTHFIVTLGCVGGHTLRREIAIGDAMTYDTGDHGKYEVRLLAIRGGPGAEKAHFQVAKMD